MKTTSILILALAVLFGMAARPWPKPTPPPPPSPIYTQSAELAFSEEEIAGLARDHNLRLEQEIERALIGRDPGDREAAFTFLLPELVQVDPGRVAAMVAEQKPGEARDTLRTEVTRQWIAQDLDAAVRWMKTLPEDERRASAETAIASIAAHSPREAMALAKEFGIKPSRD
ncbi:MAG TPA: hypothetical protein VFS58_13045 [Steroidobacteraceae bacterium]|nr:hypothetical protein [Steroidobacteraceae bacterium]